MDIFSEPKRPNFKEYLFKVEKILKGSLDSIPSPSPSVKIQIIGGRVCLSRVGNTGHRLPSNVLTY